MRLHPLMLLSALALTACSAQAPRPDISVNNDEILILAPQGVDPAKDTVGFNDLCRRVTQAFSADISPQLQSYGKRTVSVLDQGTQYDVGQKLAMYSARERAPTAIVLTIQADTVGGDQRISLQAQGIKQHFNIENGAIHGVTVDATIEQSYVLRSTKNGDNPRSMGDLASDFVKVLKAQGWL